MPTKVLVQKPTTRFIPVAGRYHGKGSAFRAPLSAQDDPNRPHKKDGEAYQKVNSKPIHLHYSLSRRGLCIIARRKGARCSENKGQRLGLLRFTVRL